MRVMYVCATSINDVSVLSRFVLYCFYDDNKKKLPAFSSNVQSYL